MKNNEQTKMGRFWNQKLETQLLYILPAVSLILKLLLFKKINYTTHATGHSHEQSWQGWQLMLLFW